MRTSLLHKHGTQQERIGNVTDLTLMTFSTDPTTVLPSLTLLSHRVRVLPMDASSLVRMPENTILLLDARDDLASAKTLCRLLHASGLSTPIVLILTEGGFTVVNGEWGVSDVIVNTASPAEVEGRLRLVTERVATYNVMPNALANSGPEDEDGLIRSGDLVVDTNGYTANLRGVPSTWHTRSSSCSNTSSSTPVACSRERSCCRRFGVMTTTAARAPSTCMCGACVQSSAANTNI